MTPEQRKQAIDMILDGVASREIAEELGIEGKAVSHLRKSLRRKGLRLPAADRSSIANLAIITKGLLELGSVPIDWSKHPRFEDVRFKS